MHKRQDKLRIAAKLASYRDLTTHALDDGFRQGKTDSDTVRIDLFVDTIETFENIFQFRLRDAAAPHPSHKCACTSDCLPSRYGSSSARWNSLMHFSTG